MFARKSGAALAHAESEKDKHNSKAFMQIGQGHCKQTFTQPGFNGLC